MTAKHKLLAIANSPVPKKTAHSLAFIVAKKAFLQKYGDFDVFVDRAEHDDTKFASAIFYNMTAVRTNVVSEFWRNEIFIGIDVVDRLLFDALCDGNCLDPRQRIFEVILKSGVHRPGFVVYPLHSFGIQGFGLLRALRGDVGSHLVIPEAGIAVSAQTNGEGGTLAFLESAQRQLGIDGRIDAHDVAHFHSNRVLKWMTRNPLIVIKVASFQGNYYENQRIYMLKLRLAGALLMFLSVLAKPLDTNSRLSNGSSRRINNWQTLDIKHYLTFERVPNQEHKLNAIRIPMNSQPLELALLSDLNVDVDPRSWRKKAAKKTVGRLALMLRELEERYRDHVLLQRGAAVYQRLYRKLLQSIEYFRRSFSAISKPSEATISLAIALETLLTDHFAPGITEEIHRRVGICLKGKPGVRKLREAVRVLFETRGQIVHLGSASSSLDLADARRAYVHCLEFVASRTSRVQRDSGTPMKDIID